MMLDEDDIDETDELSPEELSALYDRGDGGEAEDAELLRHMGILLEQQAAGVADGGLALAALMTEGDLWQMSDADAVGIAVKCREVASRAQGRMYRALQELERRRPPSKRYRRGEQVRERRDTAGGIAEDAPPAPRMRVMASAEAASEIALAFTSTEYGAEQLAELSADLWARLPRLHLELEAGRADADRVRVLWKGTLLMPWRTLAGMAAEPGELSWYGPVTPAQARDLAHAAAADEGARWSVIVTDDDGHALAFAVLRHPRETGTPGLAGEVTLTITASLAAGLGYSDEMRQLLTGLDPATAELLENAITIANQAAADAELRAILDEAAGGCAHALEVPGYTVPETIRRWLHARDRTCRNPICRYRATQCDLDHTLAYDQGGRTCPCDLGAVCRHHHQLKQLPGWHVEQDGKGHFTWTTPAGLTYRKEPHEYLV